jgi:hypothetical protein
MSLKKITIHELEQSAKQTLARIIQLRQSKQPDEIEAELLRMSESYKPKQVA